MWPYAQFMRHVRTNQGFVHARQTLNLLSHILKPNTDPPLPTDKELFIILPCQGRKWRSLSLQSIRATLAQWVKSQVRVFLLIEEEIRTDL